MKGDKKKAKKANAKSKELSEERIKLLLAYRSNMKPVPTFKEKKKRPLARKFFMYSPIDQPLSDKIRTIKARTEDSQKAKTVNVASKLISHFVTENEEDVIHRK